MNHESVLKRDNVWWQKGELAWDSC